MGYKFIETKDLAMTISLTIATAVCLSLGLAVAVRQLAMAKLAMNPIRIRSGQSS